MIDMYKKIKELLNTEAIRYIVVGGCTTLVNLVVFTFLCEIIKMNENLSNIISIIVAILFAYVTNKVFVFKSHCTTYKEVFFEFTKFVGARLLTMMLEVGGFFLLFEIIGQNKMIAKLETQIFVLIGNFFISKFLVFVNKEES